MRTMIRHFAKKGMRRIQRARAGRAPHGVILLYHRIAAPLADPWNMAVQPENFADHLEVLKKFAAPKKMRDVAAELSEKSGPKRSIAITFDDGYFDNLSTALPILEAHGVPATVFVVSGAIGKPDAFWWDLLTRVFLETPRLPEVLTVRRNGSKRCFNLGSFATYSVDAITRRAAWRADLCPPQDGRQRVFLDVWRHMLSLCAEDRIATATQIANWAKPAENSADAPRPMNQNELNKLAGSSIYYFRSVIRFEIFPMFSTSHSTTSPGIRNSGGVLA